ncbi:MAG: FmdB family zinc ribbon protein [Anaerolineae bacterium]|jgi:putative FmdB family regulatory protein
MPTYRYKCEECGIQFDRFQHFSEDPLTTCPECEGFVRRVIQPVGIIFKGSGFYVTDNRSDTSSLMPKSERNESKGEASESKSAPAKSESSD